MKTVAAMVLTACVLSMGCIGCADIPLLNETQDVGLHAVEN